MKNCIVCKSDKFLDKKHYVDMETERNHYLKHDNDVNDIGYRKFLSRLTNPLKKYISIYDLGLDYGCGYAPALVDMLIGDGYKIEPYDIFFFPNENIFSKKYNFITCSEVVEHFFNPNEEFNKLDSILEKNGFLAIMTCFMTDDNLFKDWYYRRDPTHVVFYNEKTFEVIATQMNWKLTIPNKDIVLYQKKI